MTVLTAGCFGKLPCYGDFIRVHAEQTPVDAVERWFSAGKLDPLHQDGRMAAFAASGPAFAIQQGGGSWWGSALFASRDQVGRLYPFAVFTSIPIETVGAEVGVVPTLFIPFFQKAMQAAAAGWPDSVGAVKDLLATLTTQIDVPTEEGRLVSALDTCTNHDLWTSLLGGFPDPRGGQVFADLAAIAHGVSGGHGLRIQPMAHQIHFCFWLMLLWLLRDKPGAPALLALLPESPGRSPSATVLFDRPTTAQCFATLWPACASPEMLSGIHDLVHGLGQASAPALPEYLEDGDLSLRDVLHALASAGRELRHGRARR
jgi:type VI secretion system ImpM family protein